MKSMNVLGIESSCDETAAAVVRADGLVFSDVVASQVKVHAPYGGVVPEIASREHMKAISLVTEQAMDEAAARGEPIHAVAVTNGPGLVGALNVGLNFAKAFAWARGLPFVGVDHLKAHLFAVFLRRDLVGIIETVKTRHPSFPYGALLVSGGHTALYRVNSEREVIKLGETRDDAAGEAFDKVAKLVGLGYPGGPIIDKLAADGNPHAIKFPIPMRSHKNLDFSFSGLKTSVARYVELHGEPKTSEGLADFCASFQYTVVESLTQRSLSACQKEGLSKFVISGGVAANRQLRARMKEALGKSGIDLYAPDLISCTDNAAMIAYAGALRLARGERDGIDLDVYSRDQ